MEAGAAGNLEGKNLLGCQSPMVSRPQNFRYTLGTWGKTVGSIGQNYYELSITINNYYLGADSYIFVRLCRKAK